MKVSVLLPAAFVSYVLPRLWSSLDWPKMPQCFNSLRLESLGLVFNEALRNYLGRVFSGDRGEYLIPKV